MNQPDGDRHARRVQAMFERIAPSYDLMNRMMTFGQDLRWRKSVIQRAALAPEGWLLDLGTGTGDLVSTALEREPAINVVAADFTLKMMQVGAALRSKQSQGIHWLGADASAVPFDDNTFDAVVSGFLLRNVSNLQHCLSEQLRVLKPGCLAVALDTSPPPSSPIRPLIKFHLHTVIPTLGRLIADQSEAYHYLPETTEGFLQPEQLASRFLDAGFVDVGFERHMFGTVAIHWGIKPGGREISS